MHLQWRSNPEEFNESAYHVFEFAEGDIENRELRWLSYKESGFGQGVALFNRVASFGLLRQQFYQPRYTHFFFEDDDDYIRAKHTWVASSGIQKFKDSFDFRGWEYTKWRCTVNGVYHRFFVIRKQGTTGKRAVEVCTAAEMQEWQSSGGKIDVQAVVALVIQKAITGMVMP